MTTLLMNGKVSSEDGLLTSMSKIAKKVCETYGHVLVAWVVDGTSTGICNKCGMTLAEIRGEKHVAMESTVSEAECKPNG